jgi:hypothetical protein
MFEIGQRPIIGKTASEVMQHAAGQVEAQELELVLTEKVVDLWQRKLMFLDVEQQVAAGAGTEEIVRIRNFRQRRTVA